MTGLPSFPAEFAITIANGEVWLSIGIALLLGGACWAIGTWVARLVGLLDPRAPAGETLGVGLASGLIVLAALWAAIWSGGRSSFAPVAIGFAIVIVIAVTQRARSAALVEADEPALGGPSAATLSTSPQPRSILAVALAGAAFVVAVAILYGSTMAPSPRNGVQPVEFVDEAYYSILARDLATTGTETNLAPSGFSEIPGAPAQTWYHWGEIWLASAVITLFGTAPMAARYFVVLPVLMLAAAALTGTLVRRVSGTTTSRGYLFGVVTSVFLAPLPLILGPFFSASDIGLIFGITTYGLAAIAVLLAMYWLAVAGSRATWALAGFVGLSAGSILPAHVAIAALSVIGVGSVCAVKTAQALVGTHRLPDVSSAQRRVLISSGGAMVATLVWGAMTGHGLGGAGAPPIVTPFNETWQQAVGTTIVDGGLFFAIPVAWLLLRRERPILADLCLGAMALLVAGAVVWGARFGDFTMFHVFYGGIAVFGAPIAAVSAWTLWVRLRERGHLRLATGLAVLCLIQLDLGVLVGIIRMEVFGPHDYSPISVSLLNSISRLPPDAKLAYACQPLEEVGFGTPRLLSIDAHTGHRIVPMCFEAEVLSNLIGAKPSLLAQNLFFTLAPQRALYPDANADPSSGEVAAFLKDHGIHYIYADARHPNTLVVDAIPMASGGDAEVLRVP